MFRLSAAIGAAVFTMGLCVSSASAWAGSGALVGPIAVATGGTVDIAVAPMTGNGGVAGEGKLGADMAVALSAQPSTAEAGDVVVLSADVANYGPQTATNVGFSLELPAELAFVGLGPESSRMASGNGEPWTCNDEKGPVVCMLTGQIAPPQSAPALRIETVVVEGAALGPVEAEARVSSFEGDNWPENNVSTATVTITGIIDPVYVGDFECAPGRPDCPRKAGVYTTREEFIAAIPPGYYEENFAGLQEGTPLDPLPFSGAGISYQLMASRPWNPDLKEGGLFTWPGIVSTNTAADAIVISVTSGQLMAIGANFYTSDIHSFPYEGDVTITLSDGTVETFYSTGKHDFRGFVAEMPIKRIEIRVSQDPWPLWPAMQNLIVSP